ncbi:MAG: acyl-CoA thioesterase [Bdellovibrionales bacterium]
MNPYQKIFEVRWADLDPNLHLRHTAYNDYAAHVRFAYLAENGFTMDEFQRAGVGPVIFTETTRYRREVRAGEIISVQFHMLGMSQDHRKFHLYHRILKQDGEMAAEIEIEGAWFDTRLRKVCPAPAALAEILQKIPREAGFKWL